MESGDQQVGLPTGGRGANGRRSKLARSWLPNTYISSRGKLVKDKYSLSAGSSKSPQLETYDCGR